MASLCWILGSCASPPVPHPPGACSPLLLSVLGSLHTTLPAFFPMARIYLMENYVNGDANWIQPRGAWPVSRLCSLCWKTAHHSCSKGNFQPRHSSPFFPYKGYCAPALSPQSTKERLFSLLLCPWQLESSWQQRSLKMPLARPWVCRGCRDSPSSLLGHCPAQAALGQPQRGSG